MKNQNGIQPRVLLANICALIAVYYLSILCHEWGHGTVAWLYGLKSSPFSVHYGGWFLLNVDEDVNYTYLLETGKGTSAALIGIAGPIVSLGIATISLFVLNNKKILNHPIVFTFVYWLLVFNMLPLIQYLTVSLFAIEGDTSRFAEGFALSRWWVFIPGTLFNILMITRILRVEIIKAYVIMPVHTTLGRNILLFVSLFVMLWFIYIEGFNPLTAKGLEPLSKGLAIFSIALLPVLFVICNPALSWIKHKISIYSASRT